MAELNTMYCLLQQLITLSGDGIHICPRLQSNSAFYTAYSCNLSKIYIFFFRYVKAIGKLLILREKLQFFITSSLIIKSQETRDLAESLSPSDKRIFPFNPIDIDWDEYIPIYYQGIREFLLKK